MDNLRPDIHATPSAVYFTAKARGTFDKEVNPLGFRSAKSCIDLVKLAEKGGVMDLHKYYNGDSPMNFDNDYEGAEMV